MSALLTIGKLAKTSDTKVQTIRYYEQIGLLPQPQRSQGNQRLYQIDDANRLNFIRHSRALGFSLEAIRELLELADSPEQTCEAADQIARSQLENINQRLTQLEALKTELERMIEQCAGGRIADCRIIEVLNNHSLCLFDHSQPETPRK